jgi:copper resistance protein B
MIGLFALASLATLHASIAWDELAPGMAAAPPVDAADPAAPQDHDAHDQGAHDHADGATPNAPTTPAGGPSPPGDHAAERFYSPAAMAQARAILRGEHGGEGHWSASLDVADLYKEDGGTGLRWRGESWIGGDLNNLVVKTEGKGVLGRRPKEVEIQAVFARAAGPYFDLQAGLRQDVEPKSTTYAVLGFEGLAPYWVDVSGGLSLSHRGDVSARLEAMSDFRITQRLVLQPRAEVDLNLKDPHPAPQTRPGEATLGLRLRYEITPELGPYIGVVRERSLVGRRAGESGSDTRLVIGLRAWL